MLANPNYRLNLVIGAPLPVLLCLCGSVRAYSTIYVDASVVCPCDGTTWQTAFNDLQDALEVATANDQIWVANGTYIPSVRWLPSLARTETFQVPEGFELYGGFAGGEQSLSERDFQGNVAILSGDLDENDGPNFLNTDENSYNVVQIDAIPLFSDTTIVDGFQIRDGNANHQHNLVLSR